VLEPLKITAKLFTGRIATTDLALPIDSIMAHSWMQIHYPELLEVAQSGIAPDVSVTADLPLDRREAADEWYWAASFAFGQPVMEEVVYWHKRFDAMQAETYVDFGKSRGVVDTKSGHYKAYRMPLCVFLVPEFTWYVVGDQIEIKKLLDLKTHIGKKPSQGYGRVREWIIEPAEEDLSHVRPIPDPNGADEWGIRPPYWALQNSCRVQWPQDERLACNWLRRGINIARE
jgi:CRISPR type IV-associated protein Csf3